MKHRLAAAVVLLGALAACDSTTGSRPGAPTAIEPPGAALVGVAGEKLPQPVRVRVVDARGRGVPGQAVNFVVTAGGGSVSAAAVTTDAEGIAATEWTLGPQAGATQSLEARIGAAGGTITSGAILATVHPAAPAQLVALSDTLNLSGSVGGPARDTLRVRVLDAYGNPVPGVDVQWAATEGGGSMDRAMSTTDAGGVARAVWILGPRTDLVQGAVASVPGAGIRAFYGRAGNVLSAVQGNGVTASAGTTVGVAVLLDGDAGGVPGARVEWTVLSGGGSVAPAASLTQTGASSGRAGTAWTLGTQAGTQTLRARVGTLETTFAVTAIGLGTRTPVATVPGRVLDAEPQRIVWLDSAGGTRLIKLRSVPAGTDVVIKEDTAGRPQTRNAHLFDGGVLLWPNSQGQGSPDNALFEYRSGTLTLLGTHYAGVSARGDWAAWRSGTDLLRRSLPTGVTTVIRNSGSVIAVGETGDVSVSDGGAVYLYRNGVFTPVTLEATPVQTVLSDGVNTVYYVVNTIQSSASLWLDRPEGDQVLAAHSTRSGGIVFWDMRNGWIAYSTGLSPTTRRRPDGTIEQVSLEVTATRFEALGADGTVVYHSPTPSGRYFMVLPDGSRLDLGPARTSERVVWRGGQFLLVEGGTVYRLAP